MERKIGEIFNYQDNLYQCIKPIVALIQGSDNSEQIEYYTENGIFSNGGTGKNRDLMILLEKKEGWVNIYGEEKKGIVVMLFIPQKRKH